MSSRRIAGATADAFHIMTVGWDSPLIRGILQPIEARTGFRFSHAVLTSRHGRALHGAVHAIRDDVRRELPVADQQLLGSLERPGVPTIHNMILGDSLLSRLPYDISLRYATLVAVRLLDLLQQVRPSMVLGGFDGLHGSLGLAAASKLEIPWFAMHFSVIPEGLSCFCSGVTPSAAVTIRSPDSLALRQLADQSLREFEAGRIRASAYLSANDIRLILSRMPSHAALLTRTVRRGLARRIDKCTEYAASELFLEYVRKRTNLLRLPSRWLCTAPPREPYVFLGLHMQPESSIDVWAPFYANQFDIVETIARAVPPTHRFLVKLHKSAADRYSPRQLDRLRRLPGVSLVSPFADSRGFIESASLVLAIQGTIALEAALLGKPVLMFGDSRYSEFPSVTRVRRRTDLPHQIREKLTEQRPNRDAILQGYTSYLAPFLAGCDSDWSSIPSEPEIDALSDQFRALRDFVAGQSGGGQ